MNAVKRVSCVVLLFFSALAFSQSGQKFKVALDAGHGDHDFGAVYNGHIEKKIALAVVLKVGKILEQKSGVEVIYTRKTDTFIDLIERANIANRADANIFVSIHCNANKNSAACGSETYVMGMSKNASNLEAAKKENEVITMEKDYQQKYKGYDPKSPESIVGLTIMQEEYLENSIALAGKIQNHFIDQVGSKSRGVKQAPFMVLHKAYMPRVLIEMGFISNPEEGAKLDSEAGQQQIAEAIANAIMSYKKEFFSGDDDDDVKPSQKMEPVKAVDSQAVNKPTVKTPESKKPETKPEPISTGVASFKVQLSASSRKLDLVPSNFNGLNNISVSAEGSLYKYMYGETSSYEEAKKMLAEAKAKGFSSAFVIAFKNGRKVSVQEALKQ
ncbi:N-acetylmuramoyl-L-alanine amidase [Flavobacterium sedimenticola]|uniref:N-acetylmuramoyl-L-alanine amidase n=1 Tax=Flavobacterium sedimenticola TaxID=3043286 RepID=A0ABT6XQJ2_9FLAO|nr:N-acetylmuramoyl-L-alanine amidase [Flavobacterium sedimenticola]MDI9257117.1 N-acetylmuramoyl-L-alanine amidase [Flavobacterium sedimenticola]